MLSLRLSTIIEAEIAPVWQCLRDFGRLGDYHLNARSVTLAAAERGDSGPGHWGDRVGCVRHVELHNGGRSVETLTGLSDRDYSASYSVMVEGAPFTNMQGTYQLRSITDRGATFLEWSWVFDVTVPGQEAALQHFLEQEVYDPCVRGLRAFLAKTQD